MAQMSFYMALFQDPNVKQRKAKSENPFVLSDHLLSYNLTYVFSFFCRRKTKKDIFFKNILTILMVFTRNNCDFPWLC